MITEIVTKTDNYWIEGLGVSNPSPMTIEVAGGKFYTEYQEYNSETKKAEVLTVVDEYPAFSFDVVSDPEVDVIYDVYLLDLPSSSGNAVHVDRTELGAEELAFYQGEDVLRFTLASFLVPANTTSLENVEIRVNRVVKNDDENTGE